MIALLVMTDSRRHCIEHTLDSACENLQPWALISELWIHDDSGDPEYQTWLRLRYRSFTVVSTAGRSGFGGAIRSAWATLRSSSKADYVFHLEDDFTFNHPIDLAAMMRLLDEQPHLAQVALRRQPWNDDERDAGGIVESHPCDYTDRTDGLLLHWLEHRRFFTTNPSLYRRQLIVDHDWPDGSESEGHFSAQLFGDPAARSAYWGARDSGEWVTHIGAERVGTGY